MLIRNVQYEDAPVLLDIYRYYVEHTAFTFETSVPSPENFASRIKTNTEKYPWLVAEQDGDIVGYAYASKHRERQAYQWSVESSVYVTETYHSKGVAKELYLQLFDILQRWGYVNVYAGITLPNPKSYSFHTKMGFEPVGVYKNIGFKLGKWHDVAWLAKTVNPHTTHPATPAKAQ